MDDARRAAYAKIDEGVRELTAVTEAETDDGVRYTPTDYVLVVGAQGIDDEGDRVGYVTVYPQHGSQPSYITTGLLSQAQEFMSSARVVE